MRSQIRPWFGQFSGRQRSSDGRLSNIGTLLSGLGLGTVLAYFFDLRLGRRRRAWAHDKVVHAARLGSRQMITKEHHLLNRVRGQLARLRSLAGGSDDSDEIVEARLRAALGRACSHPSAITTTVRDGHVELCGPVLAREHKQLLSQLARVRGVHAIHDQLERHVHPEVVPGLREGGHPAGSPAPKAVLRCADIMKRQVQASAEGETIQRAAEVMAFANVGFLPVCDLGGRVVGTITDRDIVVRALAAGRSLHACHVGEVMTREVVACRPDDDVTLAEEFMAQHQVSRLAITDETGVLNGVISLSDLAEKDVSRRVARTLRAIAAREAPRD